ncbi:DUF4232 domain-containing protein [Streptomyces sp. NPDC002328]|uniref:DUF4232 domain-containing protein n=1 Tax=Streptomyces sp. NPDC002328 TaxID=3364642 RepID=UPI00369F4A23
MRRPAPLLLPALAAALLLSACGSERADDQGGGSGAASSPSRIQVTDPVVDGVRITSLTLPPPSSPSSSPSSSRPPSAAPSEPGDFTVTADSLDGFDEPARSGTSGVSAGSGVSAAFEVTNEGAEALTYTILFDFTTGSGEVMANKRETVRSVGPGRTVRGTVQLGELPPGASPVTRVKVAEVDKVPAGEAPAAAGDCPASGIRVWADEGDAAMGLRVVGLHLEYCAKSGRYTVDGYPLLELLDDAREPVDGVRILQGSKEITTGISTDGPPRPVALKPGEKAVAHLVWRNTTEFGTPVNVPYVRVRAKAGADPVTVNPRLDLGTTGKLGVTPWTRPKE